MLEKVKIKQDFFNGKKLLKHIIVFIYELINKFSTPSIQLEAYKAIFSSLNYTARMALDKFGLDKVSDQMEIENNKNVHV